MKLALNISPAFREIKEFYNVEFHGCSIGRVWLAADRSPTDQPWDWLISLPMTLPESSKGVASSLNDAMSALASAFAEIVKTTPAARLQRAFDFAAELERKSLPSNVTPDATKDRSIATVLAELQSELTRLAPQAKPPSAPASPVQQAESDQAVNLPTRPVANQPAVEPTQTAAASVAAPPAKSPVKETKLGTPPPARPKTKMPAIIVAPKRTAAAQPSAAVPSAVILKNVKRPSQTVAPATANAAPANTEKLLRGPVSCSGSLSIKPNQATKATLTATTALPPPTVSDKMQAKAAPTGIAGPTNQREPTLAPVQVKTPGKALAPPAPTPPATSMSPNAAKPRLPAAVPPLPSSKTEPEARERAPSGEKDAPNSIAAPRNDDAILEDFEKLLTRHA